jgi:hypothetical protein
MKNLRLNKIVIMKSHGWVFTAFLALCLAHSAISYTQTISSGGKMAIMAGSMMTSTNDMKVASGGTLDIQGTLILKKNLINEYATPNSIGTGTLELSGTTAQSVSGQNIIRNLVVNNTAGVSIGGNTRVDGTLTLTNGVVSLGTNNLTLGPIASVSGTPSASKMIAADGTGQLRKEFASTGSFTYPVGDVSVTPEYSPVTLAFTSGTFGSNNYAGVNLKDETYASSDITNNYLTRYWNLTQNNITGFNCNATFQYLVADVTGTESGISCVKVNPLPWEGYSAANTATHVLTANGINTFSTFTGASIHSATLKVFLEGLYAGSGTMNQAYDDLGPHFAAGIADQVTVELHNSATYSTIAYSLGLRNLSTTGNIAISAIPAKYSSSYYLTIKHRNSIETTSGAPVSFAGSAVNYDFTTAATKAYGDNMKLMGTVYAIWGGDVNQDGIIDTGDMNPVENASTNFVSGYVTEDVNGDGFVDTGDMNIVENNSTNIIMAILP